MPEDKLPVGVLLWVTNEEEGETQTERRRGRPTALTIKQRRDDEETKSQEACLELPIEYEKNKDINIPYSKEDPQLSHVTEIRKPYQYFLDFFDQEIVDEIVKQTNIYGQEKQTGNNNFQPTSREEIYAFLGILLYMGVNRLPAVEDYWASVTQIPQVINEGLRDPK